MNPLTTPPDASIAPGADAVTPMPWGAWRSATVARIALGRAGVSMPTDETLRFGVAHAQARDAIHTALDVSALTQQLQAAGHAVVQAHSCATDRASYLRRPDLGRQLQADDIARLQALAASQSGAPDVCIVVGDGLSSLAVQRHAVPLISALTPLLDAGTVLAPVVVVQQARVAVADDVGEALRARLCVILIGERPGLSSPDSLGIYVTHAPCRGRHDAQRNCISNVRPEGLPYPVAAQKLAWLIRHAFALGATGIALKDQSADSAPQGLVKA